MSQSKVIQVNIETVEDRAKSVKVEGDLTNETKNELKKIAMKHFDTKIENLAETFKDLLPPGSSITFRMDGFQLQLSK